MTPPAPLPSGRIVRRRPARPRRPLVLVAVLVTTFLVAACGGPAGPGGATAAPDGDWLLRSGTSGTSEVPIIEGHDITLTIDGDDWGGTAACNSYGGTVDVDGSQVTAVEVWQTEMACMEDGVMESEAQYLDAFRQVSSFEVADDRLILRDGPGDTELVYDRATLDEDSTAPA